MLENVQPVAEANDDVFYDLMVEMLLEAERRGLVKTACSTHDGIPMLNSELVTFEEDYDMCIPVVRVFLPEQVEAVKSGADEIV